jgi:hypothetical protein
MRVRRNRTAIHLQPFERLCQLDLFGFHRFFTIFTGFCGATPKKVPILWDFFSFWVVENSVEPTDFIPIPMVGAE